MYPFGLRTLRIKLSPNVLIDVFPQTTIGDVSIVLHVTIDEDNELFTVQ